jgi:DivIVA domain-containing protein
VVIESGERRRGRPALALLGAALLVAGWRTDGRPGGVLLGAGAVLVLCGLLGYTVGRAPVARRVPAAAPATTPAPGFTVVLRGYDRAQVDSLVARAQRALDEPPGPQRAAARAELDGAAFIMVLRGYHRGEVDEHLRQLAARLGGGPTPPAGRS